MRNTMLTAHSGSDGTADNSREFLEYAFALETDLVEVDVRKSREGALVLTHDAGEGAESLRTAFSLLSVFPGKKLNCDLKAPGLETGVWLLAAEYGVQGRIVFSGTVSEATYRSRKTLAAVDWFVNPELLVDGGRLEAAGEARQTAAFVRESLRRMGAACLNANYRICRYPLYDELRRLEVPLSLWTPNEEEDLQRFLEDGVYNITTRSAAKACCLRAGRAEKQLAPEQASLRRTEDVGGL